jgi:ribosomal protein S27AE
MAAKRLKRKRPKPWILRQPDAPEVEPPRVTCPGCGATAELADHTCPQCGQLFYERPHGHVGRENGGRSSRYDPDIVQFASRMDRIEKWARVICVVAGCGFAALTIVSVVPPSWLGVLG